MSIPEQLTNPCADIVIDYTMEAQYCETCATPIEPGSGQALLQYGILCNRCINTILLLIGENSCGNSEKP